MTKQMGDNQPAADEPRLCTLLESYYPVVGGMETQARNLATILAEQGVEQIIVTRRTGKDLARAERVDDICVYRAGPSGRSSRYRWAFLLSCMPLLFKHRRKYDVILVPGFRVLGMAAVIMSRLLGKKCVFKAECIGEMSGEFFTGGLQSVKLSRASLPFRLLMACRNAILRRADVFVSMYSEMQEEYREHGVAAEKIQWIPQSVNPTQYAPVADDEKTALRRRLDLPEEATLVIYTGRIVSYKGVPLLVQIWRQLLEKYPGAVLVVVGSGGVDMFNCEDEVHAFVKEHDLESAVRFTGAVRNVHEYLKAGDIYALPTQNDAFPLCILEAMAAGMAIVTTPVGALKDVIEHDRTGYIVPAGDADALHQALDGLLGDTAKRSELGAAARAEALAKYTREIVARQYVALFNACLQERR